MAYNFYTSSLQSLKAVITKSFSNGSNGHNHDGDNSRVVTIQRVHCISVEDLGAGVDIANRVELVVPTGKTYTVTNAKIISQGTAAGIDDSNKCTIVLSNGSDAIFTQEFDADPAFPADGAVVTPTLDADHVALAAGASLKYSVTNGTTANPPKFMIQLTYTTTNA